MIDYANSTIRAAMAHRIKAEYDEASVELFGEGNRRHLGASVIGKACEAEIWFGWRWIFNPNPGGRMYRLFQRGHREEPFVFKHLRRKGHIVNSVNPETGKQWRLEALHGHFGGSCDARGFMPPHFEYDKEVGYEVKTANDKQFKICKSKGVAFWQPNYARQMDVYGRAFGIDYFVFSVINKNDDDIHIEIYEVDKLDADRALIKAERIVTSRKRPARISDHPSHADCRYCDMFNHCHKGAMPEKNCRSCEFAFPDVNKTWFCEHNKMTIPYEVIASGCPVWKPII